MRRLGSDAIWIAVAIASIFVASSAVAAPAETLTPARVAALRAQVRANFFVPDSLPPLDGKSHRRFEPARGVSAEAVTYATEFGMRVPAILYLPKPLPKGRIPAVIVVDGHGGDKYSWYSYYAGITFARAGAAVLTYDQAGEGERSSTRESHTREHDKLEGGPPMARRLAGLMITDVMQAVSYLASRPEVDPARIGAAGYSMGSFVLALAGAVEPRLRACAMVGGGNLDGPGGYWDGSKPMCQGLPYQSLSFLGDRGAVLYALHVARGPVMIWNGRADSIVAKAKDPFFAELRTRARQLAGRPDAAFEIGFTNGTGHRPYFLTRPVVSWLAAELGFPNWTPATVKALPEVRIGDWARTHGIAMDAALASEEKEGGTLAVGDDVPAFLREDLSVFAPAEWDKRKSVLAFSAWIAAATAFDHAAPGK
jgi:dienelactone hydrolase